MWKASAQETIGLIAKFKWIYLQVRIKYLFSLGIKAYRGPSISDSFMWYVVEEFFYVAFTNEERTIDKSRAIPLQMFHCRLMRDGIVLSKRITRI